MPGKSSTTEIRELDRVTSKLRIGDSAQTDAGRYSCEAENAYGKSHFSLDVTIWGENVIRLLHSASGFESNSTSRNISTFVSQEILTRLSFTSFKTKLTNIQVYTVDELEACLPEDKFSLGSYVQYYRL